MLFLSEYYYQKLVLHENFLFYIKSCCIYSSHLLQVFVGKFFKILKSRRIVVWNRLLTLAYLLTTISCHCCLSLPRKTIRKPNLYEAFGKPQKLLFKKICSNIQYVWYEIMLYFRRLYDSNNFLETNSFLETIFQDALWDILIWT